MKLNGSMFQQDVLSHYVKIAWMKFTKQHFWGYLADREGSFKNLSDKKWQETQKKYEDKQLK